MRKPRLIVPGYTHHVILRGNNRRRLFSYPNDYWTFMRYLRDAMEKHDCQLHGDVLMTNHGHFAVTPPTLEALPKAIHMLAMRYAQHRNRKYGDTGKLFEARLTSF